MLLDLVLQGVANKVDWLDGDQARSTEPNVSIVIPYYNRPTTLKQTLFSILRVDYDLDKPEIIIVDDGSDPLFLQSLESLKPC